MVTEGWTLFKHTCEEVGPGELPQLLRQLKSAMTPTPAPTPASPGPSPGPSTPVKTEPMEEEGEVQQLADLGASGFIEMAIMIKLGPHQYMYKCGNCDIAQGQNVQWMHTSIVCTQRRPSCAPSVILACTIWIHSRDMRRSTSRVFLVLGVML